MNLREHAEAITSYDQRIEDLQEERERLSWPLEAAANKILKGRHQMRRTGMSASLDEIDNDGNLHFSVSNGIDYGDDFGCSFTLDELENPRRLIDRYRRETRRREQAAAANLLREAQRRAEELGVDLDD